MCFRKVKDGHLTIPHSGMSFRTVQKKSMTVCTMYEIYIKFILNYVTKWTGMEPETDFVIASIVGTEVSVTTCVDV